MCSMLHQGQVKLSVISRIIIFLGQKNQHKMKKKRSRRKSKSEKNTNRIICFSKCSMAHRGNFVLSDIDN